MGEGPPFMHKDQVMKLQRRTVMLAALAGGTLPLLQACGGGHDEPNLVEAAFQQPQFSILVEAIGAAGLADTLRGSARYTVFAPTDSAFAALLSELGISKAALLADTALLKTVLTYHLLPGKVESTAVAGLLGRAISTVQGGVFKVESNHGLKVTDGRNRVASITATDLQASNGVIHTVDRVLLPADKSIVQTAQSLSDFSILVEAVVAAGLVDALSAPGPFTVFAPTNAAFAAALAELGLTKQALLSSPALASILTYHVVSGRFLKAEVPIGSPIVTLQGEALTLDAGLKILDRAGRTSGITGTDVFTRNGVIHVVDRVLLPSAFATP